MAAILSNAEFEGATATLWLADKRLLSNPRDAVRITTGEIRNIVVSEATCQFDIITIIGIQEKITIPRRVYQASCNYVFGDSPHCGVDLNYGVDSNGYPIQYQTTVQAGSTDEYLVLPSSIMTGALADTNGINDFFETGYIVMTSGVVGLQDRPINTIQYYDSEYRFYLGFPLTGVPAVGDGVLVRRNCRLTKADCALYHNGDASQFGGFAEVPPVRFKPTKVPTPT